MVVVGIGILTDGIILLMIIQTSGIRILTISQDTIFPITDMQVFIVLPDMRDTMAAAIMETQDITTQTL